MTKIGNRIREGFQNAFSGVGKNKGSSKTIGAKSPKSSANKKKPSEQKWKDYWDDIGYNEASGNKLANAGRKTAKEMNGRGGCATGVKKSYNSVYGTNFSGDAYTWDDKMRTQKNYKEVSTKDYSKKELENMLKNLPAGAVVCWEKQDRNGNGKLDTDGEKYGHVTIADGKGGEYSDHHASSIYVSRIYDHGFNNGNCSIFIPV